MLGQRILTAAVLLAVFLAALFAPTPWPFEVLVLAAVAVAGWEWGRLNGAGSSAAIAVGAVLALAGAGAVLAGWAAASPSFVWQLAAVFWIAGGALALRAGPSGWPRLAQPLRIGLGVLGLWSSWLAMANARAIGINFLLSVFCLVWVADIAAYFGGRAFGRRKLAPSISPGKSWAGVWSGMVGVLVLMLVWVMADRNGTPDSASLFTQLHRGFGPGGVMLAVSFLAAMSVVGDLIESSVKRAAGAKDSSGLLPGHGGVLDRIDALLPVFPLALALAAF